MAYKIPRESILLRVPPETKAKVQNAAMTLGISMNDFFMLLVAQWEDGIRFERDKGTGAGTPEQARNNAGVVAGSGATQ